jgi:serine/threonine protein kinase
MHQRLDLKQIFNDGRNVVHPFSLKIREPSQRLQDIVRVGRDVVNEIVIVENETISLEYHPEKVSLLHFVLYPGLESPHLLRLQCGTKRGVLVNRHEWKKHEKTYISVNDVISFYNKFQFIVVRPFIKGDKVEATSLTPVFYDSKKEFVLKYGAFKLEKSEIIQLQSYNSVKNEIFILKQLPEHPNIIKPECFFFDRNATHHLLVLVTPKIKGGNLAQLVARPETQININNMISGIIEGISHIHNNKIIHGDLKPENILVDTDNEAKPVICDFGFSRLETDKPGLPGFTNGYAAPEIKLATPNSKASDVWSLGCVLNFLYTKQVPFQNTQNMRQDEVNSIIENSSTSADEKKFLLTMLLVEKTERSDINTIRNDFVKRFLSIA